MNEMSVVETFNADKVLGHLAKAPAKLTKDHKDAIGALVNTLTVDVLEQRGIPEETINRLESGFSGTDWQGVQDFLRVDICCSLLKYGLTSIETAAVLLSPYKACDSIKAITPDAKRFATVCKYVNGAAIANQNAEQRGIATANGMPIWVGGTHDEAGLHPLTNIKNVQVALEAMHIGASYDSFRDRVLLEYKGQHQLMQESVASLTDGKEQLIIKTMSDLWGFDPGDTMLHRTLLMIARQNSFDPVLDYLDRCEQRWRQPGGIVFFTDKETCDEMEDMGLAKHKISVLDRLPHIFNVDDTLLNREILKTMFIASVRRARVPGCKFDAICVLESIEGFDKSKAIATLYGKEFFSDQHILGKSDREVQELLSGVWGYECADLSGMRKADVDSLKAFASRQEDRARPAYGRNIEWQPRRCVLWGTTNNEQYLQSQTGNRRFWPLRVNTRINLAKVIEWRDAIWGEAAYLESKAYDEEGKPLDINLNPDLWAEAGIAQEARRARDPWEDLLRHLPERVTAKDEYGPDENGLMRLKSIQLLHRADAAYDPTVDEDPDEYPRPQVIKVAAGTLLTYVLGIPLDRQTSQVGQRLATVMANLGWQRTKGRKEYINGQSVNGFHIRAVDLQAIIDAEIENTEDA